MQCCNCDQVIITNPDVVAVQCDGGCGATSCPSCKDYVFSIYYGNEDEAREKGVDIRGIPVCDDCINKHGAMIEESIEELAQWSANTIRGSLLAQKGSNFHEQLKPYITNMILALKTRAKETNLDLDDKIDEFEEWLQWFFE